MGVQPPSTLPTVGILLEVKNETFHPGYATSRKELIRSFLTDC